jgi:hypothetical protein
MLNSSVPLGTHSWQRAGSVPGTSTRFSTTTLPVYPVPLARNASMPPAGAGAIGGSRIAFRAAHDQTFSAGENP